MRSVRAGRSEREVNTQLTTHKRHRCDFREATIAKCNGLQCWQVYSITPVHSISPCNSKRSALKKQPQSLSLPTHNDFRRGKSNHQFTTQFITQLQQRIVQERSQSDRNGLEKRTVLQTTHILGNYRDWMHEAVIRHNELLQFGEMTHLHTQDMREGIGADMNGLQRRIILQTQLCHILFTSTMRAAIQMRESGGYTEWLWVGEGEHAILQ